jgi:3-methyladenine DNA glycosylase AlkC
MPRSWVGVVFRAVGDPLKTFFNPALVKRLAAEVQRAQPSFAVAAFVKEACRGLDDLALLARGKHISVALAKHLPKDYPAAIDVLLRSLGPKHASDELLGVGMAPFYYLPHLLYVEQHGLSHFELSLQAQYELTQRFSAESSIRAYIAKDPERTFNALLTWATDQSAHVRRLVSEGTRLRLPWASRVAWLDSNPERVLALLEVLKDDPASVVRRSVANNLNDLSKVYPKLTLEVCARWSKGASGERKALIKHALRTLVKRGQEDALALMGVGAKPRVDIGQATVTPKRPRVGGQVRFSFELTSTAKQSQELLVDFAVHFVKANGLSSPKVFKLRRLQLGPKARVELEGRVSLAPMTTRKHYPGKHRIDVLVNGVPFELLSFDVLRAQ